MKTEIYKKNEKDCITITSWDEYFKYFTIEDIDDLEFYVPATGVVIRNDLVMDHLLKITALQNEIEELNEFEF